ncbi:MAG: hypothetical protein E8D46_14740 [Nitrospira sp.]|nr:MAG: hypothetical protein E8D46_14740 [Nitrospira sp.]
MKRLILVVLVIWGLFYISSFVWSSKGQPPSPAFSRLMEPPQYRLSNPYENGYYFLLGFAADISLDPAKVGHEMWLESASPGVGEFNYDKPGRAGLRIQLPIEQILPAWNSKNPEREFRNMQTWLQPVSSHDHILLARYAHWTEMPFEDRGFGYHGTPRLLDIFAAHRLYIADGFSHSTTLGMQRLRKDMRMWRSVLQGATTIVMKSMAQVIISDDLRLLSNLLSQPTIDKTLLAMTHNIAPPLTAAESSFRWPLQHQFVLGVRGDRLAAAIAQDQTESPHAQEEWLTRTAHLPSQAFLQIAHHQGRSFLGIPLQTSATWERYATHYEAMIQAADVGQNSLQQYHDLVGARRQTLVGQLFTSDSFEPNWDPFLSQLRETDARLRLASLQAVLRHSNTEAAVPTRLAQVGSAYYDPFSGLPMLWSPTQQKIYSVGKDRYDDGGDVSFDISVPAIISPAPRPNESTATTPTKRTNRR